MTVREINAIVRACDGRNVYLVVGNTQVSRIVGARMRAGKFQVRILSTGAWIEVDPVFQGKSAFEVR